MPILRDEEPKREVQAVPPNLIAPMPALPNQDFFRFRIDGTDIFEEIQHQLRGEIWVDGVWKPQFEAWMNDDGINKVTYVVYACGINKNTFLGNLSADQINFKCNALKKKLARLFAFDYNRYDIKKSMRDLLITTVMNTIHSALSRCEAGKEANQLSTATQRHEIYQQSRADEKEGFLRKISPFRLRR